MVVYIPKVKPKRYITKKENSHCGIYAVENVLNAYNKKVSNPKELHSTFLGKKFGWTLPWDIVKTLNKYQKNNVKWKSARKIDNKIEYLEKLVRKGPVIIRIDLIDININPLLGRILSHWIVIWGYDSKKKEFYAYDSRKKEKNLKIGNSIYKYKEIIKLWKGSLMLPPFRYLYIAVNKA